MRNGNVLREGLIVSVLLLFCTLTDGAAYDFGGGPADYTQAGKCNSSGYSLAYSVIAEAIGDMPAIKNGARYGITPVETCGSLDNLKKINSGELDLAIVESTDLYFGRNGKLYRDSKRYTDVLAVAYLFGSYAQLITLEGKNITTVHDLDGRTIASTGISERSLLFDHLGLSVNYGILAPGDIDEALTKGVVEAVWRINHFPDSVIEGLVDQFSIRFIGAHKEAAQSGFYSTYPCFSQATIPAGTYSGMKKIDTFQYGHVLVARHGMPSRDLYDILEKIYSSDGLQWMRNKTDSNDIDWIVKGESLGGEMAKSTGRKTIITPFHPSAEAFWNGEPPPIDPSIIGGSLPLLLKE